MRPAVAALVVIASGLAASAPAAAEDGPNGAELALSCAACHGTNGHSPGAIPSIQGKSAAYIEDALNGFKAGSRPATVMNRLAKGYSAAEIKALAAYFSTVK
jgi:cytochrome subunit of sulfide dehydrogenase